MIAASPASMPLQEIREFPKPAAMRRMTGAPKRALDPIWGSIARPQGLDRPKIGQK
jgi:hypothetical protein